MSYLFVGTGFVAPHMRQRFTELGCSLIAFITPALLRFTQAQAQCVSRVGGAEPGAGANELCAG